MFNNKLHILLLISVLISFFFSCKEKDTESYSVKGKLININDSVFFAARETNDSIFVDTIKINNKGEFSFSGHIDTLTVISLYFKNQPASPYILVDKGWKVDISGDVEMPDLIEVRGGEINNELTNFKKTNAELLKTRKKLVEQNNSPSTPIDSIMTKTDAVEVKNIDFDLNNIASDYVKNNPEKISSVIILDNFFKNEESLERLSQGLDQLQGKAYDFPLATQLREYRDQTKKSAVNAYIPPFNFKDEKDNLVSSSGLRGKYILLNFVSSTCKACQEILPVLVKEYDKIKKDKKNIEVISLVKDVEEVKISNANMKTAKWSLIPVYGGWGAEIFENYNIKEVPYSILISTDGKILERNVPIYNLNDKLNSYPNIKKKEEKKDRNNKYRKN